MQDNSYVHPLLRNQEIISDQRMNDFCMGLKDNRYKYHQFYNTNIDPEKQHFIRFMLNYNQCKKDKLINKTYYDIEVVGDGETFPDPTKVEFPVTSIAFYNTFSNIVHVYSLVFKECNLQTHDEIYEAIVNMYEQKCVDNPIYRVPNLKIELVLFKNDHDLLNMFFTKLKELGSLMLMGFNSKLFDDPYVVNRAHALFGESYESIISEFDHVSTFGNSIVIPDYEFVDLLSLYQPPDSGGAGLGRSLSSYKLDNIAKEELTVNKLDFEGNFLEYFINDIGGFLTYNIFDTLLTYKLDQKLEFTELIYDMSNYNNATFGTSIGGRSIMYRLRNDLHYSKKEEIVRSKLFAQEVLYGFE